MLDKNGIIRNSSQHIHDLINLIISISRNALSRKQQTLCNLQYAKCKL